MSRSALEITAKKLGSQFARVSPFDLEDVQAHWDQGKFTQSVYTGIPPDANGKHYFVKRLFNAPSQGFRTISGKPVPAIEQIRGPREVILGLRKDQVYINFFLSMYQSLISEGIYLPDTEVRDFYEKGIGNIAMLMPPLETFTTDRSFMHGTSNQNLPARMKEIQGMLAAKGIAEDYATLDLEFDKNYGRDEKGQIYYLDMGIIKPRHLHEAQKIFRS